MTPRITGHIATTIVNRLLSRPHTPEELIRTIWRTPIPLSRLQVTIDSLIKRGYDVQLIDGSYYLVTYPALCCLTDHERMLVEHMPFSLETFPGRVSYKTATNQLSLIRKKLKPFGMTISKQQTGPRVGSSLPRAIYDLVKL